MPEKARVFVNEDRPDWQRTIGSELEKAGHIVVGKATSFDQAYDAVETYGRLKVQAATVDGSLTEKNDGDRLAARIRERAPGVKIVSLSGGSPVEGADVDVGKLDIQKLAKVITRL